ncbi:hypothetical protein SAMN05421541_12642 [Actinoplanes philippinensis]|uniref:Uncharacterized protein n=1 Tax=Actinoplanes philippinensis TaxID=35752 RepID=A0A1I2M9E0_9ACTN|nr:hypothetical protein [Actinoplanes philippinensis]SFF86117.1 hypothetical protein SAMN05421541_12642 [Actinoplanes philippinensis]
MTGTRGTTLAWLGHPVTMAALAVLVINDHVLKAAHPGWVTGKLSDAAGMLLAPPLLAALTGLIAPRLPLRPVAVTAIVTVGAGFTFVKLWGYGAELASATWSLVTPSLIRADPADLIVLPLLAGSWWTLRRSRAGRAGRVTRAVRVAVLLPLALAGVAATSPLPHTSADLVLVEGDAVYLRATAARPYREAWSVSRDGGVTWTDSAEPASWPQPAPSSEPVSPQPPDQPVCSRDRVCYRVVEEELAVQSSTGGGPWTDSWRVGEDQRQALLRDYGDIEMVSMLSARKLAVQDVAGGHVVVVANDRDGFAVRDPAGRWTRIGFPAFPDDVAPLPLSTSPHTLGRPLRITVIALLAGFLLTVAGVVSLRRSGGRRYWWLLPGIFPPAAVVLIPIAVIAWRSPASVLTPPSFVIPVLAVTAAASGVVIALSAAARHAPTSRAWSRPTAVAAVLTAVASAAAWWLMS